MFLEREQQHYDVPRPLIPDLTFEKCENHETTTIKSVKDRMFLSTDDTSCLLFTQTVTSPMLTPSEENIDFLKGFQEKTNNQDDVDFAKTFAEPIYENIDSINNEDEHIYENITTIESKRVTEDVTNEELGGPIATESSTDVASQEPITLESHNDVTNELPITLEPHNDVTGHQSIVTNNITNTTSVVSVFWLAIISCMLLAFVLFIHV